MLFHDINLSKCLLCMCMLLKVSKVSLRLSNIANVLNG